MLVKLWVLWSVSVKLLFKYVVIFIEVWECFSNFDGCFLEDLWEVYRSDLLILWFVVEIDFGCCLKVCFIFCLEDGGIYVVVIKIVYDVNDYEICIYRKYGMVDGNF